MPNAAFCGLPHSESEVYYVKSSTIGLAPKRLMNNLALRLFCKQSLGRPVRHAGAVHSPAMNPIADRTCRGE